MRYASPGAAVGPVKSGTKALLLATATTAWLGASVALGEAPLDSDGDGLSDAE